MVKKSIFISGDHKFYGRLIGSQVADMCLMGSAFQCLKLTEFVSSDIKEFKIENYETTEDKKWKKTGELIFKGVNWLGHVRHSDAEEMSACLSFIDFSYEEVIEEKLTEEVIKDCLI